MKTRHLVVSLIFSFVLSLALMTSCRSGSTGQADTSPDLAGDGEIQTGINIGQRAPELLAATPGGDNLALSSLRGKMVLVDFWASWCSPCRHENPYLVALYQKYRNETFQNGKGFTIYSVSLDRRDHDWVGAIEKDSLIWKYHVSDLKGWSSVPAARYGVRSIPANFLIDGEGIIVATNLRGQDLEGKLKEYVSY